MLSKVGKPKLCTTCRGTMHIWQNNQITKCPKCHGDGIEPRRRNG